MPGSHHSTKREQFERCFIAGALGVLLALALFSLRPTRSFADRGTLDSSATLKATARPQTSPARPEVVLDATRRDHGEVFAGEELDSLFRLVNTGKAPLELLQRSVTGSSLHTDSPGPLESPSVRYHLVPVAARLAAPS